MKIQEAVKAYNTLSKANVKKMTLEGKMKVVRSVKVLKTVAQEFQEFSDLTQEKLKGEKHEHYTDVDIRLNSGDSSVDKSEVADTRCYFRKYNTEFFKCVHQEELRDVEVKVGKLTKKEFDDLLASNDFDAGTIADLSEILQ